MVYGWVVEKRVHLAVPLIMQFIGECSHPDLPGLTAPNTDLSFSLVGLTVTSIFNMVSTLLVDAYPGQSASATAANNLYRCLVGAAGTAVIDPILSALGSGAFISERSMKRAFRSWLTGSVSFQVGPSP